MPYRIKRSETVPKAVRRIALEQIDRARTELRDTDMEAAESVHQARKRFKKLRALLRLVRPTIGANRYKRENRCFRDLGRKLAGARDAEVLLETLDSLVGDSDDRSLATEVAALRQILETRRDQYLEGDGADLDSRMAQVAAALDQSAARVAKWNPGAAGFAAVGPGLKRSYRQGREAMRKALRQPGDAPFHEWRKRVKDHWYHSRLLQGIWPALMKAHGRELKRLSDLLGDDHDLAVFRQELEELPGDTLSHEGRRHLLARVACRQDRLRSRARRLGARVYAESPKRFRKRWRAYWRGWRSSGT
ncbi:MAG: CHAD domain-containing protein [Gammaproteobacteria bacterium]|jgi:CHAD domain-containing protein